MLSVIMAIGGARGWEGKEEVGRGGEGGKERGGRGGTEGEGRAKCQPSSPTNKSWIRPCCPHLSQYPDNYNAATILVYYIPGSYKFNGIKPIAVFGRCRPRGRMLISVHGMHAPSVAFV